VICWKSSEILEEFDYLQGPKSKPTKNLVGSKAWLGFTLVDLPNIKDNNLRILNGTIVKFSQKLHVYDLNSKLCKGFVIQITCLLVHKQFPR
jgi:hypothetical protein